MDPKGNCKMYLPDKERNEKIKDNLNVEIRKKKVHSLQDNLSKNGKCNNNSQLLCGDNFTCFNISSICLYNTNELEQIVPCEEGSHLHNCQLFDCDVNFKCRNSYCVSWDDVWDGKWDCPNGDDECSEQASNNGKTCKGMFKCKGKKIVCIHLGNVCDASHNCPQIENELFCKLHDTECLPNCNCLGFALHCINTTVTSVRAYMPFLFVRISHSDLGSVKDLSFHFAEAVFMSLVQSGITQFCLSKTSKNTLKLDLSYNLIQKTVKMCYFDLPNVKMICLNKNIIHCVKDQSFVDLPKLLFLNLSHNLLAAFSSHILHKCPSVKIINIEQNNLTSVGKTSMVDLHVEIMITDNYHICCVTSSETQCFSKGPWYISCTDLLPESTMRITNIVLSLVSFVLNLVSISLHAFSRKSKKAFAISEIFINIGDIFCAVYLAVIWITDLVYQGLFMISEKQWRSSAFCFIAHGTIVWFVLSTQLFLVFLSISRVQIVVQPVDTIFKLSSFVLKVLITVSSLVALVAICLTLYAQFAIGELPTSLCSPLVDPTHALLITNIQVWFFACTQTLSFPVITLFHILLVYNLLQSQRKIRQTKSHQDSNKVLFTELALTTVSNMVSWFPVNSVYIVVMFMWRYPMSVIFWSTVAMMPINSIVYPAVFTVLWMKNSCMPLLKKQMDQS